MKRTTSSRAARPAAPRRSATRTTRRKPRRPAPVPAATEKGRGPAARPALPLLLGIALVLAILWTPFAPFVTPKPSRVWRGYQTLLVRAGGPGDARLPAALDRLGPGVVSKYTTTVDFYDFSSDARILCSGLSKRLDPMDPRRDPYIDRMAGYFSVTAGEADFHVAYIPARSSAFSLFITLSRLLGPSGRSAWMLVDFDLPEKLLSVSVPIAFSLLLALIQWRRRCGSLAFAAVGAILWAPSILAGGPAILALCLLLLSFWLPLLQALLASSGPGRIALGKVRRPFLLYAGVGAVSVAAYSFLGGCSASGLLQPVAPFVVSLLLLLLVPRFTAAADAWRRTRVFAAVPLLRQGRDAGKGRQRALSLALFSIAIVVLVPLLRGGAFPAPLPLAGARDFTWDAVARLVRGPHVDRLPDFADYVAHEAYQQTLGFGRTWSYPREDERVYRREYLVNPTSGTITARLRTVKVFDSTWLASVAARPAPGSLEALLLSQGRPVRVALRGPARALAGELPFTALVFAALLVLLCRDLRVGLLIRGNLWRLNGAARRDQIP